MKIRFNSDKERNPTQDGGLKVLYAPGKRVAFRLRWYLILLLISSPLLWFFGIHGSLALTALEEQITLEDVSGLLRHESSENPQPPPALPLFDTPLREAREAFERLYFEHHLRNERANMTRIAERTGLERTHLYRKLKQLGLNVGRRSDD